MATPPNTAPNTNPWMKDWQALSRKYWNAWQDMSRQVQGSVEDPMKTPWHEGLEQWSRLFEGGTQSDTVQRMMANAKTYTAFMQSMVQAAAANKGGDFGKAAWTDALRQGFNLSGTQGGLLDNPMARAMRDMSGKGAHSFEDMMQRFTDVAEPFMQQAKSWMDLPAFGSAREQQEHYQKSAKAMVDYQEQMARYNGLMFKASQRGFELFQDKLAEREEPGRQVDSLRALYDLWVDAAEEAYAEIALSPEFREVYGALVNAQMRVRSHVHQEVERLSTDLGIPTRSEINTIGKRLQELRRDFRSRQENDDSTAGDEIAALRREVAQLKRAVADLGAGAAAKRPAAKSASSTPKSTKATKATKSVAKRSTAASSGKKATKSGTRKAATKKSKAR